MYPEAVERSIDYFWLKDENNESIEWRKRKTEIVWHNETHKIDRLRLLIYSASLLWKTNINTSQVLQPIKRLFLGKDFGFSFFPRIWTNGRKHQYLSYPNHILKFCHTLCMFPRFLNANVLTCLVSVAAKRNCYLYYFSAQIHHPRVFLSAFVTMSKLKEDFKCPSVCL